MKRISLFALIATLLLTACTGPQSANEQPEQSADQRLQSVFEEYFALQLERNPIRATFLGDHRFNDRLAITIAPEWRDEAEAIERRFLARAESIDPEKLDHDARLSRTLFIRERESAIAGYRFPDHLIPLNQFYNMGNFMAQLGSGEGAQPFNTVEDYEDFLSRMEDFTRWVDQAMANMREGIERGVVQPGILMQRTATQMESQVVDDPTESIFWRPVNNFPDSIPEAERERLRTAYREAIENRIVPDYRRLSDFIRKEYMPHTLETDGMTGLPNGDAWYAHRVRETTTTDLSPAEIHRIGLAEVERIHGEIREVMDRVDFDGSLDEFFEFTGSDPRFYPDTQEELLQAYEDLRPRVEDAATRLFDITPDAEFEIRPVEPFREQSASGASYQRPPADGSRPGIFYVNTYDLSARPLWAVQSLFLHEAIPGHHFQIALQQEQEHLPRFRRFGGPTAFIEGWGLYSESLGPEMGLYEDPYQYFGMLNAELWRAIRLVVDTGLHYHGWSREDVLDYMYENSAVGEARAVSEAERYMAIPSQALAYKIGQLRIQQLRREASNALGKDFDIKGFHNLVLTNGAMPLDVLEKEVSRWVEERGGSL